MLTQGLHIKIRDQSSFITTVTGYQYPLVAPKKDNQGALTR